MKKKMEKEKATDWISSEKPDWPMPKEQSIVFPVRIYQIQMILSIFKRIIGAIILPQLCKADFSFYCYA